MLSTGDQQLPVDEKESQTIQREWLLGMTTSEEQAYFEEYARSIYTGAGEIVDLGCWLGSTTIALARGLAANPSAEARRRKIHSFDKFLWDPAMDRCVKGSPLEGKYGPEESFLDEFEKRIAPWADWIRIYPVDLYQIGWGGEDIEFLLIDAMKSWELGSAIVRNFYASLIPKKSYILHQDFAHWYTSWIHLIQYRLRDYFQFTHAVPRSTSFVFQYTQQIPTELLTTNYSASSFTEEEIEEAFAYSISLVSDTATQAAIASAKVMLFIHAGDRTRARAELEKYLSQGLPLVADLQTVQEQLR